MRSSERMRCENVWLGMKVREFGRREACMDGFKEGLLKRERVLAERERRIEEREMEVTIVGTI